MSGIQSDDLLFAERVSPVQDTLLPPCYGEHSKDRLLLAHNEQIGVPAPYTDSHTVGDVYGHSTDGVTRESSLFALDSLENLSRLPSYSTAVNPGDLPSRPVGTIS
jgi:hypothetical protein